MGFSPHRPDSVRLRRANKPHALLVASDPAEAIGPQNDAVKMKKPRNDIANITVARPNDMSAVREREHREPKVARATTAARAARRTAKSIPRLVVRREIDTRTTNSSGPTRRRVGRKQQSAT